MDHLHPEQAEYVFKGLTQKTGAAAISSVQVFCNKVAALRDGTDESRSSSRRADEAAAATLEKRGIFK